MTTAVATKATSTSPADRGTIPDFDDLMFVVGVHWSRCMKCTTDRLCPVGEVIVTSERKHAA